MVVRQVQPPRAVRNRSRRPTSERHAKARLTALKSDLHQFATAGAEVYWLLRMKQSESKITPGQIERALRGPTTMRSIVSLRKLVAKHCVRL